MPVRPGDVTRRDVIGSLVHEYYAVGHGWLDRQLTRLGLRT
jgi:hypothetical protein